ncbi:MAG: SIS domain-containing protein [Phycisphaerae bacterium]|nr:SIS domain-containing protein [Phycisphaerae bacterium]
MREAIDRRFAEHAEVLRATREHLAGRIDAAAAMIVESYRAGGGVFLFGNGGSAADAQHVAGELVGRFLLNRPALKAQALSTDTSILTCLANDFSFETIFARQLEANARPGDVAVGFTTSGNSANVVAALEYARAHGLKTIAFTGAGGGKCTALADVLFDVPSTVTARVQEAGQVIYHILCEIVEAEMAK